MMRIKPTVAFVHDIRIPSVHPCIPFCTPCMPRHLWTFRSMIFTGARTVLRRTKPQGHLRVHGPPHVFGVVPACDVSCSDEWSGLSLGLGTWGPPHGLRLAPRRVNTWVHSVGLSAPHRLTALACSWTCAPRVLHPLALLARLPPRLPLSCPKCPCVCLMPSSTSSLVRL